MMAFLIFRRVKPHLFRMQVQILAFVQHIKILGEKKLIQCNVKCTVQQVKSYVAIKQKHTLQKLFVITATKIVDNVYKLCLKRSFKMSRNNLSFTN